MFGQTGFKGVPICLQRPDLSLLSLPSVGLRLYNLDMSLGVDDVGVSEL